MAFIKDIKETPEFTGDENINKVISNLDINEVTKLQRIGRFFKSLFSINNWDKWMNDRFTDIKDLSTGAYKAARTYSSYADSAAFDFNELKETFDPLMKGLRKDLKDTKIRPDHFMSLYFKAFRDQIRTQRGIRTGNITLDDTRKAIRKMHEMVSRDTANKMWAAKNAWQEWNEKRMESAVQNKVLSRDQAEAITWENPFYAAYDVLDKVGGDIEKAPTGGGEYFSVSRNAMEKMRGTQRDVGDPIDSTLKKDMEARALFARNFVAWKFIRDIIYKRGPAQIDVPVLKVVKSNKEALSWNSSEEGRTALATLKRLYGTNNNLYSGEELNKAIGRLEKGAPESSAVVEGQWNKREFDTITFFNKGKLERYLVPKEYADTLKTLSPMLHKNIVAKIITKMNSIFRQTVTTYNPAFMPINAMRDLHTAFVSGDTWRWFDVIPFVGEMPSHYRKALWRALKYQFAYAYDAPVPTRWIIEKMSRDGKQVYDKTRKELAWKNRLGDVVYTNDPTPDLKPFSRGELIRDIIEEYFNSGGSFGWVGSERQDVNLSRKSLLSQGSKLDWVNPFHIWMKTWDNLNEAVELAPRLATHQRQANLLQEYIDNMTSVYENFAKGEVSSSDVKKYLDKNVPAQYRDFVVGNIQDQIKITQRIRKGEPVDRDVRKQRDLLHKKAAFSGREATIDFKKAGNAARSINAFIPFFNAGLRGAGKFYSSLLDIRFLKPGKLEKGQRAELTRKFIRNLTKVAITTGVLTAVNLAWNGDDDETLRLWASIPDYEREGYWCWVYGYERDKETGRKIPLYWKLPKGPFGKLGNIIEHFWMKENGIPTKPTDDVVKDSVIEMFDPIGVSSGGGSALDRIINRGLPPTVKAILEQGSNKDYFTGKPIEGAYMQDKPPYQRYRKDTPAEWIEASEVLHNMGIEISPLRLQNMAKNIAGTMGSKPIDTFTMMTLVKRVHGNKGNQGNLQYNRVMAQLKKDYNNTRAEVMALKEKGKSGEAADLMFRFNQKTLQDYKDQLRTLGMTNPTKEVKGYRITHGKIKDVQKRRKRSAREKKRKYSFVGIE
jgi:hypothetical protein